MRNVARSVCASAAIVAALSAILTAPASAGGPLSQASDPVPAPGTPSFGLLVPKIADIPEFPLDNRCADVAQNSVADGGSTILWQCAGKPNQQWSVVPVLVSEGRVATMFINRNSGKCLDLALPSIANGVAAVQAKCHNGWNQLWELVPPPEPPKPEKPVEPVKPVEPGEPAGRDNHDAKKYFQFKNVRTGKCLDVSGAVNVDEAALIQWDCKASDNQLWATLVAKPS